MARLRSARGISKHRSYTVEEAAGRLGIATGTVRRWLRLGLPALTDRRPTLILGVELVDFVAGQRRPKTSCQPHECYCFSCRAPRAPAFRAVDYHPLKPAGGNLRALCEVCTTVMHKRVSAAALDRLRAVLDVTIRQDG